MKKAIITMTIVSRRFIWDLYQSPRANVKANVRTGKDEHAPITKIMNPLKTLKKHANNGKSH
ncbi:MAG: hypothetical protein JRJ29_04510 [Deltaproteobacteria bacterium]|nr:hypothetical protein [Deltaproteobacteria bacterium]